MWREHPSDDWANGAPQETYYFHMRILGPGICFGLGSSLVWALIVELMIALSDHLTPEDIQALAFVRGFLIVFGLLYVFFLALALPIRVTPSGIRCPAWWGREITWGEIHDIHYVNLLGLRFLALYRPGASFGEYIPLSIKDRDLFIEVVQAYAGEEHPLVIALLHYCT